MNLCLLCERIFFAFFFFFFQTQDKERWQRLFTNFCSRTANEEEEIVHKLLGDKFQVNRNSIILCLNPSESYLMDISKHLSIMIRSQKKGLPVWRKTVMISLRGV